MLSPANPVYRSRRRRGSVVSVLLLVVWFGLLGLAAVHRQDLVDWWQLRDYQPPAAIEALATQDTMTDYARKSFYVNHPSIKEKASFGTKSTCPNNGGEQTIVLGCYRGGQHGIFLLSVNDPRLDGVQQVTAAHEMLHAAYDRLSAAERQKVNDMLLDYYHHDLHDQRIIDTIDAYKKTEPKDVVNEMHSIFGTEVSSLPSGLETYYLRYFTQRAQVAAYAAQYQSAFTSRRATISQYDSELSTMKAQITSGEADLKAERKEIDDQQRTLVEHKNSGDITAYNAGVPVYNNLVDSYNSDFQALQNLISRYNQLVTRRNAVALEQDQLFKELDSSDRPIQQ